MCTLGFYLQILLNYTVYFSKFLSPLFQNMKNDLNVECNHIYTYMTK